ncbi:MAG: site-2 protease family protein, partial [Chloroflexi bacterium]|nr:site-2 protease family protein [Chloroflexota bacterium]
LTARAYGVQVTEFGFGFPPRLFGIKRGETLYSINLIPLGGFVRMVGENDPTHPRSLAGKSIFQRFVVIFAGAFMNALLPVVIFSTLFMVPQQTVVGQVQIQGVAPGSPADQAGLRAGDVVSRVDGHPIRSVNELSSRIHMRLGSEMEWVVRRGSSLPGMGTSPELATNEIVRVVPRWNPPEKQGPTGITIGLVNARVESRSYPFWEAIPKGVSKLGDTLVLAKNEVERWIVGGAAPQVAGPIGIAQITGEVAKSGIIPLLELAAFLSINLAILNVLPLPMLDGGRLLFLGIEWVRRGKRIPPEREGFVHMVGFAVLIALVVVISYFDILRIVRGESLFK